MSVQLLLAPAGGGKTAYVVSRARQLRSSTPLSPSPYPSLSGRGERETYPSFSGRGEGETCPSLLGRGEGGGVAPVWVVLPNSPQVAGFRHRLAQAGGALGVESGTFYRLYADVLARAGTPAPRLFDPVQHRLLRAIVDRLCQEGRLRIYAPLRDKPGFIRALGALIQELKRARVHRDAFTAAVGDQPPRLTELAAIYAAYQDWLVGNGWTDAEGQGWLAAQALERDPGLCADLALVVVDGFDEFNPTQLEVLRLLAGRATETIITLTGALPSPSPYPSLSGRGERETCPSLSGACPEQSEGRGEGGGGGRVAHRRFSRALTALTTALNDHLLVSLSPCPPLEGGKRGGTGFSPPLAHLEASLFERDATPVPAHDTVAFVEAQDRRQEVRAALRWLKARIVRDGMAPGQVALLARDLGPYQPFVEETAAEFGLPVHIAVGADLLRDPAVAGLLSLLSLPVLDWPRRPVIEALANPYFDWSTVLGEAAPGMAARLGSTNARMDAVARWGLVIRGLNQWREALERLAGATAHLTNSSEAGAAGEEEDVVASDLPTGAEAVALRRAFERFVERLSPLPQATVREYVAWLEGLIGQDPTQVHPFTDHEPTASEDDGDLSDYSLRVVAQARGRMQGACPEADQMSTSRTRMNADKRGSEGIRSVGEGNHESRITNRDLSHPRDLVRRDIAALQALKDVLRGLVLAESLLPSPSPWKEPVLSEAKEEGRGEGGPGVEIPYARFFSDLRGAIEAATYTLPPPEEDSILVAPVFHARGLSFRAVAIVGLSEGEFPTAEGEDPLLREEDRALLRERGLPLEPRLRGEEVTLFYECITRARERLLLCRPYLADDGQGWEPSPYWRHLRRLLDAPPPSSPPVGGVGGVGGVSPGEAASQQEFLVAVAQMGGLSTLPLPLPDREGRENDSEAWHAALAGAEVVRSRLSDPPAGPYEGDLGRMHGQQPPPRTYPSAAYSRRRSSSSAWAQSLAARYGPDHVWSSSRLETFAKCPFHFYLAHALHLEPRILPQEGFDPLILGSIYHRVLEEIYRRAPSDPRSVLPEVAHAVFERAPKEYGFRPTALWRQQQEEFLRVLERTIIALEQTREGYEPYAQELPFGLHGAPPLVLPPASDLQPPTSPSPCPSLSGRGEIATSIQIRGYIDRVDRGPDGSLRVVDYKAGSTRISAREVEEGTRLQLPLYALAVRDALGLGPVADGFYWHIGSASPSYLRLERYEGGVEGAIEAATGHVRAYVAAVREGRFTPTPPASGCPDHCPAVGFCWRYRPRGW